ncbi:MAG: Flp family type IVb pilin [Phycisphaerales bacterium]|nr:Flp family type IVb pilin [Phycisphaerales bacterium]
MRQSVLKALVNKGWDFAANESGVTAIEYAIIASGLSIVIVGSVNAIGGALTGTFTTTNSNLGGG